LQLYFLPKGILDTVTVGPYNVSTSRIAPAANRRAFCFRLSSPASRATREAREGDPGISTKTVSKMRLELPQRNRARITTWVPFPSLRSAGDDNCV
jgi:hypothetical protein